ncbi:MAG: class I SAM-dependent methyltransferase [Candidatus Saccharimonadales bacterium]
MSKIALRAGKFNTDKSQQMLDNYDRWFGHLKNRSMSLLELGIYKGGSLLLWGDYFKKGTIVGLDIEPIKIDKKPDNIKVYVGSQGDKTLLKKISRKESPGGFDVIIDDASHIGHLTSASFFYLFKDHLKPGGIYIIEDWGTGYWPTYPDGAYYKSDSNRLFRLIYPKRLPSHQNGMVGLVKQIIDELGADDITAPGLGVSPVRESTINNIEVARGQIAIFKK